MSSLYLYFIVIISIWRRACSLRWPKLNPLYTKIFCTKFGWNWPSGSGRGRWTYEKFTTTNTAENENQKRKKIIKNRLNRIIVCHLANVEALYWRKIHDINLLISRLCQLSCHLLRLLLTDNGLYKVVEDEANKSVHGLEQTNIFSYKMSNISDECFVFQRTKTLSTLMIKCIILKKSVCNLCVYTTIDETPTVP